MCGVAGRGPRCVSADFTSERSDMKSRIKSIFVYDVIQSRIDLFIQFRFDGNFSAT